MKTIGLLGGMSWESTAGYYRIINEEIRAKLGGLHSAKIVMYSLDFSEVEEMQRSGDWESAKNVLVSGAKRVEAANADCLLICTNTMHKVADKIAAEIAIPLIHIADATAHRLLGSGVSKVALLGTRFTMEEDFYKGRLEQHQLEVLVPESEDRAVVHSVIYNELCRGSIRPESRREYNRIMQELVVQGAEGIILGCTEIGMLVHSEDVSVPLFDTTRIHAEAAVEFVLVGERS